jgi:Tol biopolymer transport system component
MIGAFAQDGNRIAWLWPTAACSQLVQVRNLVTKSQVALAAKRGPTCPPRDGYVESLALAGTRALWAVANAEPSLSHVYFTIWVNTAAVDDRHEATVYRTGYEDERDPDSGYEPPWPTMRMAGDGKTLMFAAGGLRRVVGHKSVRLTGAVEAFAVAGGKVATAATTGPDCSSESCDRLGSAGWSPDGTKLAFVVVRNGGTEVDLADASGQNVAKLRGGFAANDWVWSDWSPDGKTLLVTTTGQATNWEAGPLYAVRVDGTGESLLATEASSLTWSPDRSHFAFFAGEGENRTLDVANADGTGVVTFDAALSADHSSTFVAWSPDSSRVAYYRVEGGTLSLAVTDVASGATHVVVHNRYGAEWSPDSSRLAYADDSGTPGVLGIATADGSGSMVVARGEIWDFGWSSDGSAIAYSSGDEKVHVVAADGSGERFAAAASSFAWSSDGKRLLYINGRTAGIVDRDGTNPRQIAVLPQATLSSLPHGVNQIEPLIWDPAGRFVVLCHGGYDDSDSWQTQSIWVVNTDGGGQRELAAAPKSGSLYAVRWSADRKRLLYVRNAELHVVDLDGGKNVRLATNASSVLWSPDESRVLFQTKTATGYRASVIGIDGTGLHEVASSPEYLELHWSPDGSKILVTAVAVTGTPTATEQRMWLSDPDGKQATTVATVALAEMTTKVATLDVAHGGQQQTATVAGGASALAFSSTLGAVLQSGRFGTRIALYDPKSGRTRGGFGVPNTTAAELSVAGNRLVYRVGKTIRLYDAATKHLSTLAVAGADPIGLSIEGKRVAWAENIGKYGLIKTITLR